MSPELNETLAAGLRALGLSPAPAALARLDRYCDLLLAQNQVMNLTAVTEAAEVVRRHFLDSAALLPTRALQGKRVVDVGTGAGFPGLVLAILEPSLHVTLLDSLGKRLDWLQWVAGELELDNVATLLGRAEELGRDATQRERYDAAVSRAVAALPVLAELCLPLVKPGGLFLAMKSNKTDEEIEGAEAIIEQLGGAPPFVMDYRLPGSEVYQRIVTVSKARATPPQYPRRWSKIKNG